MRLFSITLFFIVSSTIARADLKYHPIAFQLSTDKESYYEGEKITFFITITNTDKEQSYPVLLPHQQNTGQKLFRLNLYDRAQNTLLVRGQEDPELRMMVHDTGHVEIRLLKPLEEIVIPIYLNDFENYFNYHTQNSSHHSFGVPLFAGVYRIYLGYYPYGIAEGDSIYTYYDDFDRDIHEAGKLAMHVSGDMSPFIPLVIKRKDTDRVSIERQTYYIRKQSDLYFYLTEDLPEAVTDLRCIHITNLPPDSAQLRTGEYFYSHFTDLYAEYVTRFDNGDIREYRKFRDVCPDELYVERYDAFKNKIYFACQLYDRRYYSVSYNQPGNTKHQEIYSSEDGTLAHIIDYIYNKKGEFVKTVESQVNPCLISELDSN